MASRRRGPAPERIAKPQHRSSTDEDDDNSSSSSSSSSNYNHNTNNSGDDYWMPEKSLNTARSKRIAKNPTAPVGTPSSTVMSRPRRAAAANAAASSSSAVTVSRSPPDSPEETRKSIRLTVKMPSSKLREVTNSRKSVAVNSRDSFEPGEIMSGPRSSRTKKKIVESESEDDEEDDDDDAAEDGDELEELGAEAEDSDDMEKDDIDDDAEADEDIEMEDDHPPPPVIKKQGSAAKPSVTVTPAVDGPVKSVEAKEMEMEEDEDEDEELSDLESQMEDNSQMQDDSMQVDDDAEGEEDEIEVVEVEEEVEGEEEEVEEEEEGSESDDEETPATGSRGSTPDLSKMTKRQRGRLEQMGGHFLQLPMEPQIKKHLTAEEHAMRRAEMARRRKNLSEKRNEEEKMDTINKLLKKQAPKRRSKISVQETAGEAPPNDQEVEEEKPKAGYIRWVSNSQGCRIGVPIEWFGTPAGRMFGAPRNNPNAGRLVEEVDG